MFADKYERSTAMKTVKAKVPKNSKPQTRRNGKFDKSLTIAQIRELYKDQWLAVLLTKVDRYDNPLKGEVVAHAKTSDELYAQAKQYRLENPQVKLYTFFAGNYIPEGMVVVLDICV